MCAAAYRVRSGTNKDLKFAEKVLPILPEKISANSALGFHSGRYRE